MLDKTSFKFIVGFVAILAASFLLFYSIDEYLKAKSEAALSAPASP
ncbi:MAG: hypothetical protein HYT43_01065 [Candidatus Taylorbacteria bacterium]|nr:hypothetical protein [Candidatus Taylorbacteria bacterium]